MRDIVQRIIKRKYLLLLLVALLLASILRFYKFTEVPVSLYWDEAALGYNAYSIAETGKDEYGNSFPIMFRSFDDYKASGYIYLTAIFVKLFGLSEFSIRLGSALLGSLSVLLTYILIKDFFNLNFINKEKKVSKIVSTLALYREEISLITAFLVAISPWHLQFSRTGFEANAAHFLVLLGAVLLIKYILKKENIYIIICSIAFGLSFYFYRSILVFCPLFLLGSLIIFRKYLLDKKKIIVTCISALIFLSISLPMVRTLQTPEGSIRATQVSITHEFQKKEFENAKKINDPNANLITKVIYNRRLTPAHVFFDNYIKYFNPYYMFLTGDGNLRHGVGGMGILYLWSAPFLLLGLILLLKLKKEIYSYTLLWILLAPVPAATSLPSPHNLRSMNVFPMYEFLIALGVFLLLYYVPRGLKKVVAIILLLIVGYFFVSYLNTYYGSYKRESSLDWADGYKQLAEYTIPLEDKYERIIISGHYWKPYVYFLFYKKYPPEKFQKEGGSYSFGKYIFGGTRWVYGDKELGNEKLRDFAGHETILVALSPPEYKLQEINLRVLKEIRNHDNDTVFYVAEVR